MTRSSPAAIVLEAAPDLCLSEARVWRVWNALLGEKDNFAADREVAARLLKHSPDIGDLVRTSYSFSQRACEYLAMQGIDQFIDCNPRMPFAKPTHDIVQQVNTNARVLYVSGDLIELAHAQALLNPDHRTHVVGANIVDVTDLYDRTDAAEFLDWSRPIALILAGILPLAPGTASDAAAMMQAHVDRLCPGSYTAVTHWLQPSSVATRRTASLIEDEPSASSARECSVPARRSRPCSPTKSSSNPVSYSATTGQSKQAAAGTTGSRRAQSGLSAERPDPRRRSRPTTSRLLLESYEARPLQTTSEWNHHL